MKRILSFLLLTIVSITAYSQRYDSGIMPYQSGSGTSASNFFTFKNLPQGIYSDAKVIVYFKGDFGDNSEYIELYCNSDYLGETVPDYMYECSDSIYSNTIVISNSDFLSYIVGDSIVLEADMTSDVDLWNCYDGNIVSLRLQFDYCTFGIPTNLATILTQPFTTCNSGDPVTLNGLPAGGTFSGLGVSGNTLDLNQLPANSQVVISYTYVDNIGCETYDDLVITTQPVLPIESTKICRNDELNLGNIGFNLEVYSDLALSNLLYEGTTFLTGPIAAPTTYYIQSSMDFTTFEMSSLDLNDYLSVDMDYFAGDDRGGIAVTPDYAYFVGDNYTMRVNASDLSSPVSLPRKDGILSNLGDGKLYTLYNSVLNEEVDNDSYQLTFDALIELDSNLNYLGSPILLNKTIHAPYYASNLLLAGNNVFGFYDALEDSLYIFDFNGSLSGTFSNLGLYVYGAENWTSWGVIETGASGYQLVYREDAGNYGVVKHNILTNTKTNLIDGNQYYINDLASFTYSPWNQRFYFHYEGNADFNSSYNYETAGYIQGSMNIDNNISTVKSCPTPVKIDMDVINLGADIEACENYPFVTLFAGNGYQSYTWNGVNNNYNLLPVTQSGTYVVEALNEIGCIVTDTINISFTAACLSNEEAELATISVYPNPTTDYINIKIEGNSSSNWDVKVLDMNGRIVRNTAFNGNAYNMNISEFATGIYTLQLVSDNGDIQNIRIIKK